MTASDGAQHLRRLVGVGVGPGDPELVTVKAVRVLREADLVLVPAMAGSGESTVGRAEATVRAHLSDGSRLRRCSFELSERRGVTAAREAAWDDAADEVVAAFAGGARLVAFATIGDPNVYSTFTYLASGVRARRPDVEVRTVPGITAMQALAAASGTWLCEGTETLTLVPATAGDEELAAALARPGSVVAYKGGRRGHELTDLLAAAGRLEGAVLGRNLGLPGEAVMPAARARGAQPYLSTLLVPATGRGARGGKLG
jgi:precorrin-2/cobalt-factor-2 C20-methyltransferase